MHRDQDRYKTFSRRATILLGGKLLLTAGLVGRMTFLQIFESDHYKTLSEDNRINLKLLAPSRGKIVDRYGRPMALNRRSYSALLLPKNIIDINQLVDALSQVITLNKRERVRLKRKVKRNKAFSTIVIKEGLSWEEVARIEANISDLAGVLIDAGESRYYPDGGASGPIIGYVGTVSDKKSSSMDPLLRLPNFRIGKMGMEMVLDKELRGESGTSQIEVNAFGQQIRELKRDAGQPGNEAWLTIDKELQIFTANRLKDHLASAVVMDVHTGEVLAAVSTPSFDPNLFSRGLSQLEWKKIASNTRSPLINKAISGQYAPGSVFKMVVALAALEKGVINPKLRVHCSGEFELGDRLFHCWKKHGHGNMSLINAIVQSCDIYFYEIAKKTGIDHIAKMALRLGLGQSYGLELLGEKKGLIPSKEWKKAVKGSRWQKGETLLAGIGQGFILTTPLQLAVMTARLVNGGIAVSPFITGYIGDGKRKNPTNQVDRVFKRININSKHLQIINKAMVGVTNSPVGTAFKSRIKKPGFYMGGKTGTVQVRKITEMERETGVIKNRERAWEDRDHAIFVGFAPLNNPRYAVSVIIEHGGSGAAAAAPVARDILLQLA